MNCPVDFGCGDINGFYSINKFRYFSNLMIWQSFVKLSNLQIHLSEFLKS